MSGSGKLLTNITQPCPPFDEKIYAQAAAVTAASGFISFLANCFVIFVIVLFKKWRFFYQRLILYLTIAATFMSLSIILVRADYDNQTEAPYTNYCVFAGFFIQESGWMVFNAVTSIIIFLTISIFSTKKSEKFEPVFLIYIFLFPLTFNWIPFIKLTYGKAGATCWIRSLNDNCEKDLFGQTLQLVLWYIPIYMSIFMLIIVYTIILVKLHLTKKQWMGNPDIETEKIRQQMKQEFKPLLAYPLIFFLFNIMLFIIRILSNQNKTHLPPALWFIGGVIYPLQGSIIAITFALDPETRRRLTMANFRAAFRELCRNKNITEYPIEYVHDDKSLSKELLNH